MHDHPQQAVTRAIPPVVFRLLLAANSLRFPATVQIMVIRFADAINY
jgi:hypothetical protein